jgi:zinc finger SWIM domain-containing protein 3
VPKAELTILKEAAKVYTPVVFRLFEDQVLQTLNCYIFCCDDDGAENMYKVKVHGKHHEVKVRCSCKKFEFAGILCSHALKILDINSVKLVHEEYILKRWTIGAKVVDIPSTLTMHDDPKVQLSNRFSTLTRVYNRILARAAESKETYSICTQTAENLAEDIENNLKIKPSSNLNSSSTPRGTYNISHKYIINISFNYCFHCL